MKWREAPRGAEGASVSRVARRARTSYRNTGRESTGGTYGQSKVVSFPGSVGVSRSKFPIEGPGNMGAPWVKAQRWCALGPWTSFGPSRRKLRPREQGRTPLTWARWP